MKIHLILPLILALVVSSKDANAWLTQEHQRLTRMAVAALDKDMPAFFIKGTSTISKLSIDPDVHKNKNTPLLRERVYPEHFIDKELLKGKPFPDSYFDYMKMLIEMKLSPYDTGTVIYAIQEWAERLTVTFAEYRKFPNDKDIQTKALIYAGHLAHYAEDILQPLHNTIHHDGRVDTHGSKPHTGIHIRVDGLFRHFPNLKSIKVKTADYGSFRSQTLKAHETSFALVDKVYELDAKDATKFPAVDPKHAKLMKPKKAQSSELTGFAEERHESTVRFLAELYASAWIQSKAVELSEIMYK